MPHLSRRTDLNHLMGRMPPQGAGSEQELERRRELELELREAKCALKEV